MKSKICYNTGLEEKELFELNSAFIWKLKYIIYSENLDEDIDYIINSSEVFEQIIEFLEAISESKLDSYDKVQEIINQLEAREQMTIAEYFEGCIEALHKINNQNEFRYPLDLKDLIDNKWELKKANTNSY